MGVVTFANGAPMPISRPRQSSSCCSKASSIAYTDPQARPAPRPSPDRGSSDRFGITGRGGQEGVLATGGDDASEKVAQRPAEIAVSLTARSADKGAKMAGPLPGDTQLWTIYASAIPMSSK